MPLVVRSRAPRLNVTVRLRFGIDVEDLAALAGQADLVVERVEIERGDVLALARQLDGRAALVVGLDLVDLVAGGVGDDDDRALDGLVVVTVAVALAVDDEDVDLELAGVVRFLRSGAAREAAGDQSRQENGKYETADPHHDGGEP